MTELFFNPIFCGVTHQFLERGITLRNFDSSIFEGSPNRQKNFTASIFDVFIDLPGLRGQSMSFPRIKKEFGK